MILSKGYIIKGYAEGCSRPQPTHILGPGPKKWCFWLPSLVGYIVSAAPFRTELYVHVRALFCKQLENSFFLVLHNVLTLKLMSSRFDLDCVPSGLSLTQNFSLVLRSSSGTMSTSLIFGFMFPSIVISLVKNYHISVTQNYIIVKNCPGKQRHVQNLMMVGSPLALAVACA